MRTFGWLIAAGIAWLGLLQVSAHFEFPPQLVTLARSGYIGTFSIFMLLELRREAAGTGARSRVIGLHPVDFAWYLVPLLSVVILAGISKDLSLTPLMLVTIGVFYVFMLCLFFLRESLGQMRSAGWELAPPAILAALLWSPYIVLIAAISVAASVAWLVRQDHVVGVRNTADALIMQLPSLCLAPVILIAVRDYLDFGGVLSRAQVETFGMIVNGVGAALWTAMVMRASHKLSQLAVALWLAGSALSAMLLLVSNALAVSALAILVIELFRGTLWLGTTHLLKRTSRWAGFTINLLATALPFTALWLGHSAIDARFLIWTYAAFHLAVPVALLIYSHQHRPTQRP